MTISVEARELVRAAFDYRCAYCGVSEVFLGGELEVDHFQPFGRGGDSSLDNLVYACPTCNRFKSDYWPAEDDPASLTLLHPGRDSFSEHISVGSDGRVIGLTPRGWFHIRWLHLNRPQLIELRIWLQRQQDVEQALIQQRAASTRLQRRIFELEAELTALRTLISRLGASGRKADQ